MLRVGYSLHRHARPGPASSTPLPVQPLPTWFSLAKLAYPSRLIRILLLQEALCDQPTLLGVQLACNHGPPP